MKSVILLYEIGYNGFDFLSFIPMPIIPDFHE
jgi:hypothetical protein